VSRGTPVNALDSYCRDLTWGYDCILMETKQNNYIMAQALLPENDGEPCVPWDVLYFAGIGLGRERLNEQCELANSGVNKECAIAACKVEGLFILNIFNELALGIDTQYHVDNGWLESDDNNCPVIARGPASPEARQCCGEYRECLIENVTNLKL